MSLDDCFTNPSDPDFITLEIAPNVGITIPLPLVEPLLQKAAQCEISVEEIVIQSIKKYLERSEYSGR